MDEFPFTERLVTGAPPALLGVRPVVDRVEGRAAVVERMRIGREDVIARADSEAAA